MPQARKKFPEIDDLLYCTITRITNYGVYASLEEYPEKEGMIHISEVASSWVRNVRNHVRENQKVVCKVLRVVPSKDQIDLSIRRVTSQQRREKIKMWKRAQKGEKLLELVAKTLEKSATATKRIDNTLVEQFGDVVAGFEELKKQGPSALKSMAIPPEWIKEMNKIAETQIEISTVSVEGILDMRVPSGNGVKIIQKGLLAGKKLAKKLEDIDIEIWTKGAPCYSIRVGAENYPEAESVLKDLIDVISKPILAVDGVIDFTRT